MNLAIRFFILLSLLLSAPFAAHAQSAGGAQGVQPMQELPAAALLDSDGQAAMTVAVIPPGQEQKFVQEQIKSGQPMSAIYDKNDPAAPELDAAIKKNGPVSGVKVSDEELKKIAPLTLQQMRNASTLVIFFNLGLLFKPLYISSASVPAFWASFAYITTLVTMNDRYRFITNAMTSMSKKYGTKGRYIAGLSYSFVSNSINRFLMGDFHLAASIGSWKGLANISASALTGFFTSTVWDMLFARLRDPEDKEFKLKYPDNVEIQKTTQLMVWTKTTYQFVAGPLILSEHPLAKITGYAGMIAFGAVGVYANYFNERPFVSAGRFALKVVESSRAYAYDIRHRNDLDFSCGEMLRAISMQPSF